jgi:protein-S-isoprenylcysteine O-methyltransferase Ste14
MEKTDAAVLRVEYYSGIVPNDKPDRARIMAPPPLIVLICIALGFVAKHFLPGVPFFAAKGNIRVSIGSALVAFAIVIIASSRRAFIEHGTHPNPYTPTKAIVTDGVYRVSRNPIYIAFLLIALSFVLFTNSLWFIASAILAFLWLQFGVVRREEEYLHGKFGREYDDYCRRVRRWI